MGMMALANLLEATAFRVRRVKTPAAGKVRGKASSTSSKEAKLRSIWFLGSFGDQPLCDTLGIPFPFPGETEYDSVAQRSWT